MSTAILIDGGFFLKRYPKVFINGANHTPKVKAENMYRMAMRHLHQRQCHCQLYRIFYYDCEPYNKGAHNPVSGKFVDFPRTQQALDRKDFFNELKKRRKVALRLGQLQSSKDWIITSNKTKDLLSGKISVEDLTENDVRLNIRQKGVDMKIGIDITSLAIKRMVSQIILVSGDSDFVPAAKTARREGIDFILDPMWNPIAPDLHVHIDGLMSTCLDPRNHHTVDKNPYVQ
ncbi:MAG: NYN domain-containing protein [Candidatus Electrothrix aestuarii]|uniref:NYN domain-containing protein n=1 Tax=Candidatus Electrothrix aestuarii TaxID=3062594 RepID=A0AAU8LU23_9BACT